MKLDPDLTLPWPWWVEHYQRALRFGKAPWELFDVVTSKRFWIQCDAIYQNAQHRHQRAQEQKQEQAFKAAKGH